MHAAGILNKFRVGSDGHTAYQRMKGRAFVKELAEFGECIWYLKPKQAGINEADVRWEDGVWLGIHDNSGEVYVGTSAGVSRRSDQNADHTKERNQDRQVEHGIAAKHQRIPMGTGARKRGRGSSLSSCTSQGADRGPAHDGISGEGIRMA